MKRLTFSIEICNVQKETEHFVAGQLLHIHQIRFEFLKLLFVNYLQKTKFSIFCFILNRLSERKKMSLYFPILFLHVEKVVRKPGEKIVSFPLFACMKKSENPYC